jgi:cobalt/nickel transport system permease protein
MHIPDSVLSPATSAVAAVAMTPIWTLAARRVRTTLTTRQTPLLALGAAFCFTVMMFNVPAPGGTTAHPVAGTLLAILLGPWAAVLGISVSLAIQALFFGDGGILAYGANCFTMAFVLPFAGYTVYRMLTRRMGETDTRRVLAAAIAAYVGINAAAAMVALILGVQPLVAHEVTGRPLFFPFGPAITFPAMLGAHLLVAGPAEAIVTGLAVRYLLTARIPLYGATGQGSVARPRWEGAVVALLALVALSPLGLLAKGDAWGEWDAAGLARQIEQVQHTRYMPRGVEKAEARSYHGLPGMQDYGSDRGARFYILAGLLGVAAIAAGSTALGRLLARPATPLSAASSDAPASHSERTAAVPAWLMTSNTPVEAPAARSRERTPFLERTLAELAGAAATAMPTQASASTDGFLQRRDPRSKIVCLLGLIAAAAFLRNWLPLLALYGITLGLALASRLPLKTLLKRAWLAVPVFVGAVTLPAALSSVTPGVPLMVLSHHPYLAVTQAGMGVVALLTLRVGIAVTLGMLLTQTTRWNDLIRGLQMLPIPGIFLVILSMTYRYLTVLLHSAAEMFVARRSRSITRITAGDGRRFVGGSIGALFGKTMALSDEVHNAMISRGYRGEAVALTVLRWRAADTAWTVATVLLISILIGMQHATLHG